MRYPASEKLEIIRSRRLVWARQSYLEKKEENQENDNPTTPLATSKTSGIISHVNEPEPPILKPL